MAEPWVIHPGNCLFVLPTLAAESVQCCITSPPFYGLRAYHQGAAPDCEHLWLPDDNLCARCGGRRFRQDWSAALYAPMPGLPPVSIPAMRCELGLEPDPYAFVGHLVLVFREVRRVLRRDGTCWVNLGGSYAGSNASQGGNGSSSGLMRDGRCEEVRLNRARIDQERLTSQGLSVKKAPGFKPKDLIATPWMVALALQADGWFLRSAIVWAKVSSMPSSVTDRPTTAHEEIFLLTREGRYFYDQESERPIATNTGGNGAWGPRGDAGRNPEARTDLATKVQDYASRNLWTYWKDIPPEEADYLPWDQIEEEHRTLWDGISPEPLKVKHYAAFPTALPARCLRLGTSLKGGCPHCGSPWVRVVERKAYGDARKGHRQDDAMTGKHIWRGTADVEGGWSPPSTLGWRPTCPCYGVELIEDPPSKRSKESDEEYAIRLGDWYTRWERLRPLHATLPTVPQTVLDPFAGAGSTAVACRRLGRRFIGIECVPAYIDLATRRIAEVNPLADAVDRKTAQPNPQPGLFDSLQEPNP